MNCKHVAHLVMCVTDWLLIPSSPVLWLVALTDFQQITGDRAPSFIQRRCPQQHQGVIPYLPDLQVIGTTWANKQASEKQARHVRVSAKDGFPSGQTTVLPNRTNTKRRTITTATLSNRKLRWEVMTTQQRKKSKVKTISLFFFTPSDFMPEWSSLA